MLGSSIAERSGHAPPAVAHVPLPGVASESSAVLSTMKVSGTAQAGAARSQRQATIAPRRWVMRILPDPLALFRASDATLGRSWEEPSSSGGRDEAQAHRHAAAVAHVRCERELAAERALDSLHQDADPVAAKFREETASRKGVLDDVRAFGSEAPEQST